MSILIDNITEPNWWYAIITAGIVTNVISALMEPYTKKLAGKLSKSIETNQARREAERKKRIIEIANCKHQEVIAHIRELKQGASSASNIIVTAALSGISVWEKLRSETPNNTTIGILLSCAMLSFIFSSRQFWRARAISGEIKEASKLTNS